MTAQILLEKLETIRNTKGLSIVEFSKELGLNKDTYYNWKRGLPPAGVLMTLKLFNYVEEQQ